MMRMADDDDDDNDDDDENYIGKPNTEFSIVELRLYNDIRINLYVIQFCSK